MKIAVMQPYFFPYLGYFSLIHSVDHFMFFDDVQYVRKSWMARNRLLNLDKNEPFYIRPAIVKPAYQALLPTVNLDNTEKWKVKLLEQINIYKNRARFYSETRVFIESLLEEEYSALVDFNIATTMRISEKLGIAPVFDKYTDHQFWFNSKPGIGDWGKEVSIAMNASHYLNSPGGETFIFPEAFTDNKIKLGFVQPKLKAYNQGVDPFIPGLSILDVLFFNGFEETSTLVANYHIKWVN